MEEAIKNFPKQFLWEPEIQNAGSLKNHFSKFIICGMGGSALAADLLRATDPKKEITVHRNYSLPESDLGGGDASRTLVIASSYSGNTEETIDAFSEAEKRGLQAAVIATGGKLLELAKERKAPYIAIPDTGIQPRMATGYSIKALLKFMGESGSLDEIKKLADFLDSKWASEKGDNLSRRLRGKLPIIYSSGKNFPVAYNWKIKFNETGKIPAFANYFPELNHNEMTGFDGKWEDRKIFSFIFLEDEADDPRILKRMRATREMYAGRKLEAESLKLEGENAFHKIFQTLLIADWAALYLAKYYETDPEQVPMVEEFKKLIG